ncbi:MAG: histidine kinase dimerization/phosphoacceptor domain -containing protein [Pseudolabrys sp.]|nr:histidine kinase dimerization/phosphoacceptor domain -containing protein [Pseudolabrys sp.]
MKADLHSAEEFRLAALRGYGILDTPREEDFDDVVKVAALICDAPISVINLIDQGRQWFKAEVGLGVRETPLESSICAHAILQPDLFIVPDTTLDRRFCDNALVVNNPHLRFYAGALLQSPEGFPLGTVCILDYKPRNLDDKQKAFLRLMASQVMKMIELRRINTTEHTGRLRAEALVEENKTLIREGDHRVMNSLQLVQAVLSLQSRDASISDETKAHLKTASNRVLAIATVHKQLHLTGSLEELDVSDFLNRLCESLQQTAPAEITSIDVAAEPVMLRSDTVSGIGLLVAELVTNSFKYAYPAGQRGKVSVAFSGSPQRWRLEVSDQGQGLPESFDIDLPKGFGMQAVKTFVRRLNAGILVKSMPGSTVFQINGGAP